MVNVRKAAEALVKRLEDCNVAFQPVCLSDFEMQLEALESALSLPEDGCDDIIALPYKIRIARLEESVRKMGWLVEQYCTGFQGVANAALANEVLALPIVHEVLAAPSLQQTAVPEKE